MANLFASSWWTVFTVTMAAIAGFGLVSVPAFSTVPFLPLVLLIVIGVGVGVLVSMSLFPHPLGLVAMWDELEQQWSRRYPIMIACFAAILGLGVAIAASIGFLAPFMLPVAVGLIFLGTLSVCLLQADLFGLSRPVGRGFLGAGVFALAVAFFVVAGMLLFWPAAASAVGLAADSTMSFVVVSVLAAVGVTCAVAGTWTVRGGIAAGYGYAQMPNTLDDDSVQNENAAATSGRSSPRTSPSDDGQRGVEGDGPELPELQDGDDARIGQRPAAQQASGAGAATAADADVDGGGKEKVVVEAEEVINASEVNDDGPKVSSAKNSATASDSENKFADADELTSVTGAERDVAIVEMNKDDDESGQADTAEENENKNENAADADELTPVTVADCDAAIVEMNKDDDESGQADTAEENENENAAGHVS